MVTIAMQEILREKQKSFTYPTLNVPLSFWRRACRTPDHVCSLLFRQVPLLARNDGADLHGKVTVFFLANLETG